MSDASKLTKEQRKDICHGNCLQNVRDQKSYQELCGAAFSLELASLVATSSKNVLALHTDFSGIHYSERYQNPEEILAKNFLIGKKYNKDYDFLCIPVIVYSEKSKKAVKKLGERVGHWIIAYYFRVENLLLYVDPFGSEKLEEIYPHVKTIISRAINTVGPELTEFNPRYYFQPHNNQPLGNVIDCGYVCLFSAYRIVTFGPKNLYDKNYNLSNFKIKIFENFKLLTDKNTPPTSPLSSDIEEIDMAYIPKENGTKSPKKKQSKPKKSPKKVTPKKIITISSKKGRRPKLNRGTSDSDSQTKSKKAELQTEYATVSSDSEGPTEKDKAKNVASETMKFKNEQEIINLDSSNDEVWDISDEETPFKKSKIAETPTSVFNSLSIHTPTNEKRFFNNSVTPNNSFGIRRKRGGIAKNDTVIDGTETDIPMEIDCEIDASVQINRQILTPKRSFASNKKIKIEPLSPKVNLNDSIISSTVGATPVTTDNEADNESSFIETRENVKFSGIKACVLAEANCVVLKNRYTADPRQLMTVESNAERTILHKTNVTPKKKEKENIRFKVTETANKTDVKIELQNIISAKKSKTVSQVIVKKTATKEELESKLSDSSFKISPKKKTFNFNNQKQTRPRNNGRFAKKSATKDESESDVHIRK
uniref:Ubiquitin-like protease family profile domain-containing protein n=1 Tax=Panagrolaimus superbus TaxID=310955 RepID=A0A914YUD7_9BILA